MINKYEIIGIFASVGLMALALFLLQIDTIPDIAQNITNQSQTAAVSVINTKQENGTQALAETLKNATNSAGKVQKLIIDDVVLGIGKKAQNGDTVTVHYIGSLQNGQQFDNSNVRGEPFSFTLGQNKVIQGWEQGIVGMQKGGERILVIPPDLAYGSQAVGPIPANATLVFSVKLIDLR